MSLLVAGTIGAIAAYRHKRKGKNMPKGESSYFHGTDVLGAEKPEKPAAILVIEPARILPGQYYTNVAAGLTVIAAWTLISSLLTKKKRS